MTTQTDAALAPRDHNIPPGLIPADPTETIDRDHKQLFDRLKECETALTAVPPKIEDNEISGRAGDALKAARAACTTAESMRKMEKEPYRKAGSIVDSVFERATKAVEVLRKAVNDRNQVYLEDKARRARAEEERKAREARERAEAAAREAALAEERKRQAEEAGADARAAETEARDNRDQLEQRKLDATAILAKAKHAKALARRDKNEEAMALADTAIADAQRELDAAKEELRTAREKIRNEIEARERAERNARNAERDQKIHSGAAVSHEAAASKIDRRLSNSTEGDLARNRGDLGSLSTLEKRWVFDVTDYERLPIMRIWPHLDKEAVRLAIGRMVAAGDRDIMGVHIYQETSAKVL